MSHFTLAYTYSNKHSVVSLMNKCFLENFKCSWKTIENFDLEEKLSTTNFYYHNKVKFAKSVLFLFAVFQFLWVNI